MGDPIHVLVVDDDPSFRERAAGAFDRAGDRFTVTGMRSDADVPTRVAETRVDCVVASYALSERSGVELLDDVRAESADLPFVLVAKGRNEAAASAAKAAGATDFLEVTDEDRQLAVLAARVETAVVKHRSEQVRQRSRRKLDQYRTLVSTVTDPMFMSDADGRCTMVNEAMVEFTGSEREWLVGQHLRDLVGDAVFERAKERLETMLHENGDGEEITLEVTFEQGDGTTRIGEASVTPLFDDGEFHGTAGVVRDVSERKERELELSQYETITQTVPVGIVMLDEEARVQWANEQFSDQMEDDLGDAIGTQFLEFVERGYFDESVVETYLDVVRHLLSDENDDDRHVYEVEVTTPTGDQRVYEAHTTLLPLQDGEFRGTINAFRDITRRTAYRWELEHQNERLERFTSLVSHDLRNPLNVADGYLEIHQDNCEADDDSLERVASAHDRMAELIEDLLTLARSSRSVEDRQRVSLRSMAETAWGSVDTRDASLRLQVDGTVRAHSGRLRELFENLFRNAIEHGGEEVTVTVGTLEGNGGASTRSGGEPSPTDDRGLADGFYVADDGAGLPEDVTPSQLLEPGFTTATDGTGLGLGIVVEIAEAHGWSVSVGESADGGARFDVGDVRLLEADEAARPGEHESA